MKLHVESVFPCEPGQVWDIFNDPEFEKRLEDQSGVAYNTLETSHEGGIEFRRLECVGKKELPKVLSKALGAKHFSYIQENRLDRAKNELRWKVIPAVMSDKITAEGITTVVQMADGSHRIVNGDITVDIPFVGGTIEKAIVKEVQGSFERAVAVAISLIKGR